MRILPEFVNVTVAQPGTTGTGSAVVTGLSDTSALVGALGVSGAGVPAGTYVQSIDSDTRVTLTQPATASGSSPLTFSIEPVTLPEAKLHLRLAGPGMGDIAVDDTLIAALITAARFHVETRLRRALLTQTRTLLLDSFPSAGGYYNRAIREIWPSLGGLPSGLGFYPGMVPNSTGVIDVPLPPLQSITSVQYYDFAGTLQTFDPSAYNVSLGTPARIQPQYSRVWPISRPTIDSVVITFVCGYGDTADKLPAPIAPAIKLMVGHWYEHREALGDAQVYPVPDGVDALLATIDPGLYY